MIVLANLSKNEVLEYIKSLPKEELAYVYASAKSHYEGISISSEETLSLLNECEENTVSSEKAIIQTRTCPLCSSGKVVKFGHKNGKQRFRCKSCAKVFTYSTNTIMSGSHQPMESWNKVLNDTVSFVPAKVTAKNLGITEKTALSMRHKVLAWLETISEEEMEKLKDVAELDETYVLESMKGTKGCNGRRKPRHRGGKASKAGLSSEQVCICSGIQRDAKTTLLKSVNLATPSSEKVIDVFENHISSETIVIVDGNKSYNALAKFGVEVKHSTEEKGAFYHLNNVNSLHSYFKSRYSAYRGVASKYINRYLTLISVIFRNKDNILAILSGKIGQIRKTNICNTLRDLKTKHIAPFAATW